MGELITYAGGWQTVVVVRAASFRRYTLEASDYERKRIAEPAVSKRPKSGEHGARIGHPMFPLVLHPRCPLLEGGRGQRNDLD